MADISSLLNATKTVVADQGGTSRVTEHYLVDSQTSLGTINTAATHNLIPFDIGDLIVQVHFIVHTVFTGGTSLQLNLTQTSPAATTITGALPLVDLDAVGDYVSCAPAIALAAIVTDKGFYFATAGTLDWIPIGTFTAGKAVIIVEKLPNALGTSTI